MVLTFGSTDALIIKALLNKMGEIILPELYLKKSNRNASGIEYEHFTQRSR